jgi:hypothetical protein
MRADSDSLYLLDIQINDTTDCIYGVKSRAELLITRAYTGGLHLYPVY